MRNIYSSVECDAWSRGMSYEDYLIHLERHAEQEGADFAPLSYEAYLLVWRALEMDMHKYFKLTMTPFAAFAVVLEGGLIWATTREDGTIGLPGGKLNVGESPYDAVLRESEEEGAKLHGHGKLIREDIFDGKLIHWYEFPIVEPLEYWEEQHRGIKPVRVPVEELACHGYGNEFLIDYFKGKK